MLPLASPSPRSRMCELESGAQVAHGPGEVCMHETTNVLYV